MSDRFVVRVQRPVKTENTKETRLVIDRPGPEGWAHVEADQTFCSQVIKSMGPLHLIYIWASLVEGQLVLHDLATPLDWKAAIEALQAAQGDSQGQNDPQGGQDPIDAP